MAGRRDGILRALEELTAAELRRLKAALNRLPVAGGYVTIPRGMMEEADALDLTDLVIGHYGEEYGAEVTAEALRRIQRRDLADGLVGVAGEKLGVGDPRLAAGTAHGTADLTADVTAPSPAERFVARHRLALIQRVRSVAAILDRLEEAGVLTAEEVATVTAASTSQDRMRRLLATAPAWGPRGHRHFLLALRCLHPCLMEALEGRGKEEEEEEEEGEESPKGV
ncbi:apoptosis-associated speck-like protein containing a CARD [Sarcoramphus papa]